MLTFLPLIMRCILGAALLALVASSIAPRLPDAVGRIARWVALIAVIALLVMRIVLRTTVPEDVPSFSG